MTLFYALAIVAYGSAAIMLLLLSFFPTRSPLALRIEAMEQVTEHNYFSRQARFAHIFGREDTGQLQRRIIEAGWYHVTAARYSLRSFSGLGIGTCLGLLLVIVLPVKSIGVVIGLLFALLGFRYPKIVLDRALKSRKARVARALPDFLDMLAATVNAGLGLNAAIIASVDTAIGPLRAELESMLAEVRLGRSRAEALQSMADRINERQLSMMVTAIIQAERLGSNLSVILKELAIDTRQMRWALAEEKAAKLPILMLLPMGLLMMPSLYVMIFGPIAAVVLGDMLNK